MIEPSSTMRTLTAGIASGMCAALLATGVVAASPKLQTIDVTPAATTIAVGKTQAFTATGTFSDASKQALTAAMSNVAGGHWSTCALLTSHGVECWGRNNAGQLGVGNTVDLLVPGPSVKGISTATGRAVGNTTITATTAGSINDTAVLTVK